MDAPSYLRGAADKYEQQAGELGERAALTENLDDKISASVFTGIAIVLREIADVVESEALAA